MRLAILISAALAASYALSGGVDARTVCGDRLCSEIPGGAEAWTADVFDSILAPAAPDLYGHEDERTVFEELDDGVWRYFAKGYHSLAVVSDQGVLITDPSNDERAVMLKDAVSSVTDAPIRWVVLTHEHYDHSGGTSLFEGAKIVCQRICSDMFALDPLGKSPETVDVEFDEYLEMDVGGTRVELHHFAPADGLATTVIWLPDRGIVATADLYMPRELIRGAWMDDTNLVGKHVILSKISEWDLAHAVNAHSVGTDPEDLRENAEFVSDLYWAVLDAMIEASKGDQASFVQAGIDLPETLRLPQYSDWKGYDQYIETHVERMVYSMGWSTCGVPGCGPGAGK